MKRRGILRCIAGLLAAAALLFCIVPAFNTQAEAAQSTQDKISALKQDKAKIAADKKRIEAELSNIKSDKASALKKKDLLIKQIDNCEQDISNTESMIHELTQQIAELETQIEQKNAEFNTLFDAFKERIRIMYEAGNVTYLEILLTSKSITDMLTRTDIINDIIQSDKQKMQELSNLRNEINGKKASVEADKADMDEQKASLVTKNNTLKANQNEVDNLLAELSSNQSDNEKNLEKLEEEEDAVSKEMASLAASLAKKGTYVGGDFMWPLPGHYSISCYFGMRIHPITKKYSMHTGIDIPAPKGTKICSANAGEVIFAKWNTAYGNCVMVDHGGGKVTLYGHMSKMSVSVGQSVAKGDKLGEVGSTGYSTGNHLHFQIMINGEPVNPLNYFKLS